MVVKLEPTYGLEVGAAAQNIVQRDSSAGYPATLFKLNTLTYASSGWREFVTNTFASTTAPSSPPTNYALAQSAMTAPVGGTTFENATVLNLAGKRLVASDTNDRVRFATYPFDLTSGQTLYVSAVFEDVSIVQDYVRFWMTSGVGGADKDNVDCHYQGASVGSVLAGFAWDDHPNVPEPLTASNAYNKVENLTGAFHLISIRIAATGTVTGPIHFELAPQEAAADFNVAGVSCSTTAFDYDAGDDTAKFLHPDDISSSLSIGTEPVYTATVSTPLSAVTVAAGASGACRNQAVFLTLNGSGSFPKPTDAISSYTNWPLTTAGKYVLVINRVNGGDIFVTVEGPFA